ncbi:MAG: NYN domain-containing protein [Candidatus Omnitrophota bacterium]|nr:NYN domain-containing protein [Candidatus Omnitrophota bacterium]
MVTLVLDGYNVIHAVPELARQLDRSLEAAREALVSLCQAYQARRGDIQRVYVVFDGDQAYARGPQRDRGGVTVLFTQRHEEADDRILGLIRADEDRTRFIIVSNDTYVFNNARAHGVSVLSVKEFAAQLQPARAPRLEPPDVVEKATLSAREADQITEEYRRYLQDLGRPQEEH